MEEIKEKIKSYLIRSLKEKQLKDDEDIFQIGLVHSLFSMQLILFIEKSFKIELSDEDLDLEKIRTINAIVEMVKNKMRSPI